jgi:drug/metabolite transporter (DMT)-like permease
MPRSRNASSRIEGYGLALLAAACWATGGLTAKWLFTAPSAANASWPVPPLGIVIEPTALSGGRALAAAVILGVALAFFRPADLKVAPSSIWRLGIFGVVGLAMVHYTYFKTLSLTNVATAILLEYLAPVLVMVVGIAFLGHRFSWQLPVGVALSVTGCALVVGAIGGSGLHVPAAGLAWGLASAGFFAAYSLMGSVIAKRFASPWTPLFYGLSAAAIFWMLLLGPGKVLRLFANPATAAAVVAMAVISTIVPFGGFLVALRHIPPTNATVTSTVEPVIAGVGAFFLFGEAMTPLQLLGGALVLAAIALVQTSVPETPELPPAV